MTPLERVIVDSRKLADESKLRYAGGVRSFVAHAGELPSCWTPIAVESWIKALSERVAPQTVNGYLAGVKWAAKRYAMLHGGSDFAASAEEMRVPEMVQPNRALTREEARRLIATTKGTDWCAVRDRAILLLALRAGLRRGELARLRRSDVTDSALRVWGKGQRWDTMRLDKPTQEAVQAWLRASATAAVTTLFIRERPFLSGPARGLSGSGITLIIAQRVAQAGITGRVTPHTLRHTCATLLLEAGVPPWQVQKHMRHTSLQITMKTYAHDTKAERGEAAASEGLDFGDDA